MNVTSTTQTQYTQKANIVTSKIEENLSYEEVAQKKQPSRYETLLDMNYDNMTEAERSELSYYSARRPMNFLDEEGNKALNKALEGKTDAEMFDIKAVLGLEFMTSVKANHNTHTVDRQKFDSIDTSKSATVDRFEKFITDFEKNGSVNTIGLMEVMGKFLNIYKDSNTSFDIKTEENSVVDEFIEELYSKEAIDFKSTIIKDEIEQKVNDYAQLMLEERSDGTSSDLENAKLLNQYKNELLQEYRDSLENSKENSLNAQQQAIIKVLLDENVKETSSLEELLATKAGSSTIQEKYKDVAIPDWMDQKINTIYSVYEGNSLDTGEGWFKAMLTFNAIAMSGGQSDMKINEENLDWNEVLKVTAEGFKNNMQSSHTNEMAEKYENFLNTPGSQYYSYSDEIKQQMIEEYKADNYALNSNGLSAAESLLRELEMNETKATGKMGEMQEKYKDVYTPIPETYSKIDEELQTRKIHEAYPNYISGPEFLKIVNSYYDELGGKKIELGQTVTQDQKDKQKIAFDKAYELFGGEEEFTAMIKGAHEIMKKYPVNNWGKDERVHNETELARFTNAATYEALEEGKTIEEARIYAGNLRSSFMDTSYSTINFLETLIKAGRADENSLALFLSQDVEEEKRKAYAVDFNDPFNSTMDLREYGIEGNWEYYESHENQKEMIAEIEKKIAEFNFMLNNESKIKEAYSELYAGAQTLGNNAGYQKMINDQYMPRMEAGLNIFKNYTIYDS
ncbi:MAG: hypothetical protein GQ570_07975 [Helicobacteraceae bacterium]|nr:hypothetical protein [Helicobacteraceae bacterium]